MAGITLTTAQAQLDQWLDAMTAVSTGQEYKIGDRSLKRADLNSIKSMVEYWDQTVKRLSRGGIKVIGATPV